MRSAILLVSSASFLLCGCGKTPNRLTQFAEATRTATEQLAFNREKADAEEEKEIDPHISEVRSPSPLKLTERYETREGPDGLFVYDTEQHSVASIGGQPQQGLNMHQAAEAMDALTTADTKGQDH